MASPSVLSVLLLLAVTLTAVVSVTPGARYEPNWASLDKRPLPGWYDDSKFGIFIHWGVFSVPAFGSEWFWHSWKTGNPAYVKFMKDNYRPDWTYADFAAQFTAEFYNPDYWADVIEASGAKYVVLTSKHHEGFTNWPSNVSFNWNAMEVGPKRDLVGDLATAIRKKPDIKFGLYHSMFEWYNPLYLKDAANKYKTQYYPTAKALPELYEIVNSYRPDVIWSDGAPGPDTYWNSTEFIAWLYNDSPVKDTVVTNDRWGDGVMCKHGGFYTCTDRFNPGHLLPHKWENCMTIDSGSWGYRRNVHISTFLSIETLLSELVSTVSCGGNLLLNFGPTHDGRIIPVFEERLRQMGSWMKVNGEAIYGTKPWAHQNDTVTKDIWYTSKTSAKGVPTVYAITLKWPMTSDLVLGAPTASDLTEVTLLGRQGNIPYKAKSGQGMMLKVPMIPFNQMPCQWAWVFKMTNLKKPETYGRRGINIV